MFEEALSATGLLLGWRSYQYYERRWTSRSGELADRSNSLPKYVVSSTLVEPQWSNSRVLTGHAVNEVPKLKQAVDGHIVVYASRQLVQTLVEHDLVDELRLMSTRSCSEPASASSGTTSDKKAIRAVNTRTVGTAWSISATSWSETPETAEIS